MMKTIKFKHKPRFALGSLLCLASLLVLFSCAGGGTAEITTVFPDAQAETLSNSTDELTSSELTGVSGSESDIESSVTSAAPETSEAVTTTGAPLTTVGATEPAVTGPQFPLGIYVFTPGQKYFTRVSDYKSRWPLDDNDIGKDANGNYKAWVTGYWTRDTWNFKPEVHLICDTKYFFLIASDAERIDFNNKYWTAGWSAEWTELWKAAGLEAYKIGYTLETVLKNGETKKMTVLDPSHTFENAPYCEVWLYDEIARPNGDHVTLDLVNSKTLLTDLKITLRNGCYDVDHFNLTAFVYTSGADFDSYGFYVGPNAVSCRVSASNR